MLTSFQSTFNWSAQNRRAFPRVRNHDLSTVYLSTVYLSTVPAIGWTCEGPGDTPAIIWVACAAR